MLRAIIVIIYCYFVIGCYEAQSRDLPNVYPIVENGKIGFININGDIIVHPKYDGCKLLSNDKIGVKSNNKWGVIDTIGNEIIGAEYENINKYHDGLAAVKKDNKCGYINMKGEAIILPQYEISQYEECNNFSEGFAPVKDMNKYGYIDKSGKFKISPIYGTAEPFCNGLAAVTLGKEMVYIDKSANVVIKTAYDEVKEFNNGVAIVILNKKYGIIDKGGKLVVAPHFDYLQMSDGNAALVKIRDKFGYIDLYGKKITDAKFDNAQVFSEGLAAIKVNNKWGYINLKGKIQLPCQYDDAKLFSEGLAAVRVQDKWGFVDKTGKYVIPPQIEANDYHINSFSGGLMLYIDNNGYNYINMRGDKIYGKNNKVFSSNIDNELRNLDKYIGRYPSDLLESELNINTRIRKLAGKYSKLYKTNSGTQSPITYFDSYLILKGCKPHSCPDYKSYTIIDLVNNVINIIIIDDTSIKYFSEEYNGEKIVNTDAINRFDIKIMNIWDKAKDKKKLLDELETAIHMQRTKSDLFKLGSFTYFMSKMKLYNRDQKEAEQYLKETLNIFDKLMDKTGKCMALMAVADISNNNYDPSLVVDWN